MIGYLTAGISINFFSAYVTWRFSIQIQGFAQIPIALYFLFENETYINIETNNANANKEDEVIMNTAKNAKSNNQSFVVADGGELSPRKDLPKSPNAADSGHVTVDPQNKQSSASIRKATKHIKRISTRIDAVEMNDLDRFCSQTKVNNYNTKYLSILGSLM